MLYTGAMTTIPLQHLLDDAGLARLHVFDLAQLPAELLAPLAIEPHERQLILFAHAGRRLWQQVQAAGIGGAHPIDTYSVRTVEHWLARALPGARARFVYPGGLPAGQHLGLQRLGTLAGWHHASPFMVGVDATWGSWFAYRAAIVTDTALPASAAQRSAHPCDSCRDKPCIRACPARALDTGRLDAAACARQRLRDASPCALACPARQACPLGAEHRYDDSQIRHSAGGSLAALRRAAVRAAAPAAD